jgi:hypothetical protein
MQKSQEGGMNWNERFVSYAMAHGNSAEQQIEIDRKKYPGGSMCGYICWMSEQKTKFKKAFPECFIGFNIRDQEKWSEFLKGKAKKHLTCRKSVVD